MSRLDAIIAGLAVSLCLAGAEALLGDTIPLLDGSSLEARVLSTNEKRVTVQWAWGERIIPLAQIAPAPATALSDAQQAFARKDFIKAADLCRLLLIHDPGNRAASDLAAQNHAQEIAFRINQFYHRDLYVVALERLKDIAGEDDLEILHQTLSKHGSIRGRRAMAWLLAHLGMDASVEPLARALAAEPDGMARREIALALGAIAGPGGVPALIKALQSDTDAMARARAAEALNKIGTPPALAAIRQALSADKDGYTRSVLRFLVDNPRFKRHELPPMQPGKVVVGYYHGTRYSLYLPTQYARLKRPTLEVAVHGTRGSSDAYAGLCHQEAERLGFVVLAPYFDYGQFTPFGHFSINRGMVRSDVRLLEIVDELARHLKFRSDRFCLFGHSEGGQFVSRFVLAHSERILRAASCSSASYPTSDPSWRFPIGMKLNPYAPDLGAPDFGKLVQADMAVVVGELEDVGHRQHAEYFMSIARSYAAEHDLPCRLRFIVVPGGYHGGVSNFPMANRYFAAQDVSEIPEADTASTLRQKVLQGDANAGRLVAYLDCGEAFGLHVSPPFSLRRISGQFWNWPEARNLPETAPMLANVDYDARQVAYLLSGLTQGRRYRLGLSWWDYDKAGRIQSIVAAPVGGGIERELLPATRLPDYLGRKEPATIVTLDLPREVTDFGGIELRIKNMGKVNAVVSELWLIEVAGDSAATRLGR